VIVWLIHGLRGGRSVLAWRRTADPDEACAEAMALCGLERVLSCRPLPAPA